MIDGNNIDVDWQETRGFLEEKYFSKIRELSKKYDYPFENIAIDFNWVFGLIEKIEQQPKTDWIPFEQREADEEEKAHFLEHYGYELEYMLCGRLPDEDEEILVTYSNGCVSEDIFLRDGKECYLDSGNELVTEAIAWMPKPQPYKKEGAE